MSAVLGMCAPSELAVSMLCHACGVAVDRPEAWRTHYVPGACPVRLSVCGELVRLRLMSGPHSSLHAVHYNATPLGVSYAIAWMERERLRRGFRRWLVDVVLDDEPSPPSYVVAASRAQARHITASRIADVVDMRQYTMLDLYRAIRVTVDRRELSPLDRTGDP